MCKLYAYNFIKCVVIFNFFFYFFFFFFYFFFYQNKYGNLGYSNFLKISKTFSNKMVYTCTYSADTDQAVSLLLLH